MKSLTREISKEIYDRAQAKNGYVLEEDMGKVWDSSELWGYGVYDGTTFEQNGKFFVRYCLGDSCD